MPKIRFWFFLSALVLAAVLAGCGSFSLAEDVPPPANYKEPTPEPTQLAAASTVFPLVAPDPAQGAVIFAEKCAPCHGDRGMGDGPRAAMLSNPVAALGSPELARASRPSDWFVTVTQGRLDKFMPGFASLNDRQRWDVVAYAFTLSAGQPELTEGKALFEANCAECHGAAGLGDGAKAASLTTRPPSWQSQGNLVNLSADDIVGVLTGGKEGHPTFTDKIAGAQRYSLAAYVRSLSFASPGAPAAAAPAGGEAQPTPGADVTPAAVAAVPAEITISGKVSNATPGGTLPSGLKVKISAFQGMNASFDVSGDVQADGSYEVKGVKFASDYIYFATVDANGQTFNSDILHASDITGDKASLPVNIYETSTDSAQLRADRLHVFFDFSKPGTVQVVNLYIITNPGDRLVVSKDGKTPVVSFDLPEGAANLQFQDGAIGGGRYVQTEKGFGDLMAIAPGAGQHQILFAYDLPYPDKLSLDVKVPLPVDALIVLLPPGGVKLTSGQLADAGSQDVQGTAYQMYSSSAPLAAGADLKLSLKGSPAGATSSTASPTNLLLIGLGVFGLALIGVGIWLYRIRGAEPALAAAGAGEGEALDSEDESSESLIDQIVALDDLHASGKLGEQAYQERRAELKARLSDALQREK